MNTSRLFSLALIISAIVAVSHGMALAQTDSVPHEFRICHGYFALCAASTCTPTGKEIEVNVSGDGTTPFPEADCTCPIFSGDAIADLVGGNMKGPVSHRHLIKSGLSTLCNHGSRNK